MNNKGFTLIELLVVISIIGVVMGLSIFGLQGARESSRDSKRKADVEQVRSAIEIYKSDCNTYPIGSGSLSEVLGQNDSARLIGDDSTDTCLSTNTYLNIIPDDPVTPTNTYLYWSDGYTYEMCVNLEQGLGSTQSCGGVTSCGTDECNYKATNP